MVLNNNCTGVAYLYVTLYMYTKVTFTKIIIHDDMIYIGLKDHELVNVLAYPDFLTRI